MPAAALKPLPTQSTARRGVVLEKVTDIFSTIHRQAKKPMKFRAHRGRLDESLATTIEVAGFEELYAYLSADLARYGFKFSRAELH